SPCVWDINAQEDIMTIHSKNRTTSVSISQSRRSHVSTIIGAVIGGLALLTFIVALWFLVRKWRKRMPKPVEAGNPHKSAAEVEARGIIVEKPADELDADLKGHEADSAIFYELPASEPAAFEMHTP